MSTFDDDTQSKVTQAVWSDPQGPLGVLASLLVVLAACGEPAATATPPSTVVSTAPSAERAPRRYQVRDVKRVNDAEQVIVLVDTASDPAKPDQPLTVTLTGDVAVSDAEEVVNFVLSTKPAGEVGELNSVWCEHPGKWSVWTTQQRSSEGCNSGTILELVRDGGALELLRATPWVS